GRLVQVAHADEAAKVLKLRVGPGVMAAHLAHPDNGHPRRVHKLRYASSVNTLMWQAAAGRKRSSRGLVSPIRLSLYHSRGAWEPGHCRPFNEMLDLKPDHARVRPRDGISFQKPWKTPFGSRPRTERSSSPTIRSVSRQNLPVVPDNLHSFVHTMGTSYQLLWKLPSRAPDRAWGSAPAAPLPPGAGAVSPDVRTPVPSGA